MARILTKVKVQQEKYHITITLYEAIRFIADTFGISGDRIEDKPEELIDWEYLQNYDRIKEIRLPPPEITLKDYDDSILDKFNSLVNDITVGLPAEIELRRKQYEYYRNKLLSFEELSVSE